MADSARWRSARWRVPLISGLAVALLVAAAGSAFALSRPAQYRASATLVVLPDRALGVEQAASYYDVLSRGQVVTTFAEILRVRGLRGGGSGSSVEVSTVPDTAVIQLSATATTRAGAERRADEAFDNVRGYFDEVVRPYRVLVVSDAAGSAEPVGSPASLGAAVALGALVAGIGVAAAAYSMTRLRGQLPLDDGAPPRASSESHPHVSPPPTEPAATSATGRPG
ncbi:MAG: hypothetical protein M3Q27_13955 [Actinomycetota bacterium]|nr:hypothetical protein [Actinomycetota bacterium]